VEECWVQSSCLELPVATIRFSYTFSAQQEGIMVRLIHTDWRAIIRCAGHYGMHLALISVGSGKTRIAEGVLLGSVWSWIVQIAQEKGCLEKWVGAPRVTLEATFWREGEREKMKWLRWDNFAGSWEELKMPA
jgi:hypothetical protein